MVPVRFSSGRYKELEVYYQRLKKEAWEKRQKTLAKVYEDQAQFSFDEGSRETRWELNVFDKRKVVLDHLFGVDLDEQAVEVTRLSLMLKMLEGEHGIIPGRAVLPTLDHNIKCGNSLISGDVLKLQSFFKEDWIKTKPFDWDAYFRKIVKEEGGFDVIIGNPPYVRIQTLPKDQVTFFSKNFASATGNYDIYTLFVERGLELLKPGGILGFILPHKFFQAAYGQGLRKLITEKNALMEVVNFRDNQIFEQASTYTCLLFLQKGGDRTFKYSEVAKLEDPEKQLQIIREHEEYEDERMRIGKIPKKQITEAPWSFSVGPQADLLERLKSKETKLKDCCIKIFQGLVTGADSIYILENRGVRRGSNLVKVFSKATGSEYILEPGCLKPVFKGGFIDSYYWGEPRHLIIFPYNFGETPGLRPADDLRKNYPNLWGYLKENEKALRARDGGKMNHDRWYSYSRIQNLGEFEGKKIVVLVVSDYARYTYDTEGVYFTGGGNGPYYGIRLKNDIPYHPFYILALLNSNVLDFFIKRTSTTFRGGYYSFGKQYIENVPIRSIDFSSPKEKKLHDDVVKLVNVMLDLRKREQKATGHELEQIKRQIEKTDREIDERVYELYGIAENEKKIIERT